MVLPTVLALLAAGLVVPVAADAEPAAAAPTTDFTQYVDPFISTEGDYGHDGPGAFTPHGLAKITPLTNPRNHVGYDYAATKLRGFTAIQLDGVGANGAGGDFLVSPTYQTYTARPTTSSYDKTFSHGDETATPGYYRVGLTESGKAIDARVTADTRTGVQDYTFASAGTGSLVVDLANNFGTRQGATLKVGTTADGRTTLSGSMKAYFYNSSSTLYYYAESTVPASSVSTWGADGLSGSKKAQDGTDIGAILSFPVAAGTHVGLNVTLSPISAEQAARDQRAEIAGKSFDDVRAAATAEWNAALGAVEVEAGADDDPTGDLMTQLYTHLYRMNGSPLNATSTDGTYRGVDGKIYQADGYVHYDSWSLWDDFRKYSSIAAIYPDAYRDMAQSLVDLFAQTTNSGAGSVGSLAQSVPSVRWERAAVVIADALNKGADLRGLEAAYPSLVKNSAGNYTTANENLGFISGSVADTVGTSYDDWAMSVIATELGRTEDAARYLDRSTNYVNLFNASALAENPQALASGTGVEDVGLLMPRTANGWTSADPEVFEPSGAGLYQGTLWQYTWYDAQDMGGLVDLMGGRSGAKTALSYLFGEQAPDDCTRMLHLNANEIDLQAPYLFNYVGAPSRTQYWARSILTTPTCNRYVAAKDSGGELNGKGEYTTPTKRLVYQNAPRGFLQTMDNDAATMSSVFVSGALGLFPVTSGSDSFQIGSPLFEKVTLHYPGGTDFVIEADGVSADSFYIQDATLNGAPLNRTWLTYDELMAGGTVHFDMGSTASTWGADGPMAYSMSDEVPSSVYDPASAVSTATRVFEESDANDGSIGNAVAVSVSGATFRGADGADLSADVTATGLPAGLAVRAVRTGASTLDLTLTGRAAANLVDDSTDGVVVTLGTGAFSGSAPAAADRALALKVRFAGFSVTPSTTTLTADADGVVDTGVDLVLRGGAAFTGTTGAELPAGSVTFPGLDAGVTAVVTRTGDATARVTFAGTLSSTSTTRFVLRLSGAALSGATAAQVSGPGTTAMDPFTLAPESRARADLQALYDDVRLIGAGSYSAASFAALQTAVDAARTVLAEAGSTDDALTQALVNLRSAADGLALREGGYRTLQAEGYDLWSGGSLKTESGGSGTVLAGVSPDSWIAFRGLDFSEAELSSLLISYAHNPGSASASAKVELRTGSATGPLVTTIALPTTNGWANYTSLTHTFTAEERAALDGVNDVYLVFRGTADKSWVANVDSLEFQPVASGDPGPFTFAKLTPNTVTTMHTGLGRDGSAGAYTNFGNTHDGEWAGFAGVDLGPDGADTLTFSYDKPTDKSTANSWIDVRLGSATGTTVASTPVLAFTGTGWGNYVTQSVTVPRAALTGTQDVYFVFRMDKTNTSSTPYVANVAWFQFGDSTAVDATATTVQFESIRSGYGALNAAGTGLVDGVDFSGADLKTEAGSVGGQLAGTKDGGWVRYPVDLGSHVATSLQVRYDAPSNRVRDGRLDVYVDTMDGDPFVTVDLTTTGSAWGTYRTADVALPTELTGGHSLYFVLHSTVTANELYVGNLDWFALGHGVDKAALREAVRDLAGPEAHADRYIAAEYRVYAQALAGARAVLAAPDGTASEVATALRGLTVAAGQLGWKVVKQVDDLIGRAEQATEAEFTPRAWATLQDALGTARGLDGTSSYEAYAAAHAGLVAALGAQGVVYAPSITVAAGPVAPGATVEVSGTGFAPSEQVAVTLAVTPAVEVALTASPAGDLAGPVVVPEGTADGTYALSALGAESGVPATTDVVVEAGAVVPVATSLALHVDDTAPVSGATVTLTAELAPADAVGEVRFLDNGRTVAVADATGTTGSFSAPVVAGAPGEHRLTATFVPADPAAFAGSTAPAVVVTVTAPQASDPTLSASVSRVAAGGRLRLTGTGFAPGETATAVLHSDPVTLGSTTVDAAGAFALDVVVPAGTPAGQHTVVVTGDVSGASVAVGLTVVAAADPDGDDDPGAGAGSGSGSGSGSGRAPLAVTGADVLRASVLGLLLLAAGGVLVVVRRRRAGVDDEVKEG